MATEARQKHCFQKNDLSPSLHLFTCSSVNIFILRCCLCNFKREKKVIISLLWLTFADKRGHKRREMGKRRTCSHIYIEKLWKRFWPPIDTMCMCNCLQTHESISIRVRLTSYNNNNDIQFICHVMSSRGMPG